MKPYETNQHEPAGNINDLWSMMVAAQMAQDAGACDEALLILMDVRRRLRRTRDPKTKMWLEQEAKRRFIKTLEECGFDVRAMLATDERSSMNQRRSITSRRWRLNQIEQLLGRWVDTLSGNCGPIEPKLIRFAAVIVLVVGLYRIVKGI